MYNWKEELCKKLSNGEIAVHYNNGNLEMLRALLKKCAPKGEDIIEGILKYYWVDRKDYWNSSDKTTKPYVPLSDFIVKESEKEFVWTDELLKEFIYSMIETGSIPIQPKIEQFKASKQRKPLFTTDDGKEVFEGDAFWIIEIASFEIAKVNAYLGSIKMGAFKYFSTEAAALEFVRLNKPLYSLNDVKEAMKSTHISTWPEKIITELEKLKQ